MGDFVLLFAARLVEERATPSSWRFGPAAGEHGPSLPPGAGGGGPRQDLESQTQALGLADRVTFLGFRSDMSNLYHGADLTLCPSESETLSLLLLESLACGTPVLATRVGGIPDIVTPAHDVGCLVDYGDRAGLAAALETVMADPAQLARWGANGPRVVAETFSVATQSARMLALYEGRNDPRWN
ncbi:MAG: glycosyltransferase family 4 protein [Evtepia sp.]